MLRYLAQRCIQKVVAFGSLDFEHNEHVRHFTKCLGFIAECGIEGDILEFGVSTGGSLVLLDRLATRWLRRDHGKKYRIFGFDSFEGLPEPHGRDRDMHLDESSGALQFSKGAYKSEKQQVLLRLKNARADLSNIKLIEGWYDKVLTADLSEQLQINKASLINVDCDFYESTRVVLNWCAPLIDQGTIINFDDWFCYKARPDHGEQLAFSEFLAENPSLSATAFSTYSWHGKAFLMNKQ